MLPLYKRGNRLFVAISDPANLQALEEVRFKTNLSVEPVVVEDDKLGQAIAKVVEASGTTLRDMRRRSRTSRSSLEDGGPPARSVEDDSEVEDAPVVKYIQKILLDAISAGASDIHFEPYEKFFRIRYRDRRRADRRSRSRRSRSRTRSRRGSRSSASSTSPRSACRRTGG